MPTPKTKDYAPTPETVELVTKLTKHKWAKEGGPGLSLQQAALLLDVTPYVARNAIRAGELTGKLRREGETSMTRYFCA